VRYVVTLAVTLALAGCAPTTHATASARPTPTNDSTALACRADVSRANLHVQDLTALDPAIHDCSSLAMLEATIAANPGYLDGDVLVRDFASSRCQDRTFVDVRNALVCKELGLP
jgi:hypothetical protein